MNRKDILMMKLSDVPIRLPCAPVYGHPMSMLPLLASCGIVELSPAPNDTIDKTLWVTYHREVYYEYFDTYITYDINVPIRVKGDYDALVIETERLKTIG